MDNIEQLLQMLQEYTDKEKIYKQYYELQDDPDAKKAYLAEIEPIVREKHLLIFDFPFITHPELLTEADLYSHLSITKGSNINIVRHLRYTPVFWHSHTFFTVLYVLTGKCGHKVGELDLPMEQGDIFFLPPYVKQTIEVFDDSLILNIHIRRDTFGDYFFNVIRSNNVISNFFISSLYSHEPIQGLLFQTGNDLEIRNLFLDMYQEILLDDVYSWRLLDQMVPILFVKLLREYAEKVRLVGTHKNRKLNEQHLQLLGFIYDNYKSITLEQVAEHFHYSIPHCSALIQKEAGMGFAAFVRQIRMNHATTLLRNTHAPISEISYTVGYETPESFIRAFKKSYGMSPSQYRKQKDTSSASL
ncbi:MAG: helix-turn-helix domain-containing protein [Lachnospiraceae bacterium]|nr:helix-turn-helix domain-containing protein [Lachnospiraceae bacterium]